MNIVEDVEIRRKNTGCRIKYKIRVDRKNMKGKKTGGRGGGRRSRRRLKMISNSFTAKGKWHK